MTNLCFGRRDGHEGLEEEDRREEEASRGDEEVWIEEDDGRG